MWPTSKVSFGKTNKVFEKSVASRDGKEPYIFFEGPPSANGKPGIHHVMGRTLKDLFCRYQTLKGKAGKHEKPDGTPMGYQLNLV